MGAVEEGSCVAVSMKERVVAYHTSPRTHEIGYVKIRIESDDVKILHAAWGMRTVDKDPLKTRGA